MSSSPTHAFMIYRYSLFLFFSVVWVHNFSRSKIMASYKGWVKIPTELHTVCSTGTIGLGPSIPNKIVVTLNEKKPDLWTKTTFKCHVPMYGTKVSLNLMDSDDTWRAIKGIIPIKTQVHSWYSKHTSTFTIEFSKSSLGALSYTWSGTKPKPYLLVSMHARYCLLAS